MAKTKKERKAWFRFLKTIMRIFIKKSKFIYLGSEEDFPAKTIILSNHEGTSAPLALELYTNLPIRFWGAYEMNSGFVKLYKYQTRVYYHEKKHWNLHLARLFCLLASPLTNMFYKGLNLISTYKDLRLKKTIAESIDALNRNQDIVIFPEDSEKGYLPILEEFHKGFILLLNACEKNQIDANICVAYYKKKEKTYIIDKPVKVKDILSLGLSKDELSKKLCDRCNELGQMDTKKIHL